MRSIVSELWRGIYEFPGYIVSDRGDIRKEGNGHVVRLSSTKKGLTKVGLTKGGQQHTRSVALLVAEAYVPGRTDIFDTPIHLDGDRANCRAHNLIWRPRWFAVKYHRQFDFSEFHNPAVRIRDLDTGALFCGFAELCSRFGLLYRDVINASNKEVEIFPTRQRFKICSN